MSKNDLSILDEINLLAGNLDLEARPNPIFDPKVIDFLDSLSRKLLRDQLANKYPDVISFAYWCRRSNIESKMEAYRKDSLRLGRGLAFHVAPGNVPVNFAFSLAFSLLAGNGNVVRVPSKDFPQVTAICSCIDEVIKDFPSIEKQNALIRFDSASNISQVFSSLSDVRIIWGGDRTVAALRSLPTKPRCIDVTFSDRYSFAVIDSQSVADASSDEVLDLAKRFYNDTYLMDQNACSSPMSVIWIRGSKEGKDRFWEAVCNYAHNRYELQNAVSVDKYIKLCEDALDARTKERASAFDGYLTHVRASSAEEIRRNEPIDLCTLRASGGYFYEIDIEINHLSTLFANLDERVQTITYFGDAELPNTLAGSVLESKSKGVDRIVPIGEALDIGLHWDGFDLVRTLSRCVTVR